jgi:hypothetical protein
VTAYTDITIGRLTLRETFELNSNISAGTDTQTIVISGEESYPPLTLAQVKQRREDILGLQNRLVPISFGTKSDHDGWYRITDVNTSVRDYQGNEVRAFSWGINAEFIGAEGGVDLESRLTGIQRINDHGLTGEKWHAPSPSSFAYFTGFSQPSGSVSRAISDGGSITAWRSVPASANPRWSVSLANYQRGRARVIVDGVERTGTTPFVSGAPSPSSGAWVIENGLVSASMSPSASSTWNIAAWDGSTWDSKGWAYSYATSTSPVNTFEAASIIRNDYEAVTIRLVESINLPSGRGVVDLTLRRGSRFIEGYSQADRSNLAAVWLETAESSTSPASSGYVRATNNDAQGNRFVCGSARSFSGLTAAGGLAKTATTKLDFFIGAEVAGSAAVTGDQAANLVAQYLTAMGEVTLAARR